MDIKFKAIKNRKPLLYLGFILFVVLIFQTACSTTQRGGSASIRKVVNQGESIQVPNFFKNSKCEALAVWVKPLSKVSNLKSLQSIAGKGLIAEYTKLFADDNFVPVFGKPFDALSKRQRNSISSHMSFYNRKCGKRTEPDIKFYVSLYPGSRLNKPFGNNSHWDYTYASVVEYVQGQRALLSSVGVEAGKKPNREQQKKIVSIKNPETVDTAFDLSGTWDGTTRCFRYSESAKLKVGPRLGDSYFAKLSLENGGEGAQDIPVKITHKHTGVIETKLDGSYRVRYRGEGGTRETPYFILRKASHIGASKNKGVWRITIPTFEICSDIELARFTPIPEIERLGDRNPARPANQCYTMLIWVKNAFAVRNKAAIIKTRYPQALSSYNPDDAYFYSLAYHRFKWSFGLDLAELSDRSIDMFLEQLDYCVNESDRKKQITKKVSGIWDDAGYSTTNREMLKRFNQKGKNSYKNLDKFLAEVSSTEDTIVSQKTVENLLRRFTNEFAALSEDKFLAYLEALAERVNAQKLMVQLAAEKGLTRSPKLALQSARAGEVTPDDETLPAMTQKEVEELGKPLVLR